MTAPVFSRRDPVRFTPPGSPRTFLLAPLTFRERQAFRADLARDGGVYPSRTDLLAGLRLAVQELAPANAADLLAVIDAAEAAPDDRDERARLAAIEVQCADLPSYAMLLAARQRHLGMIPFVAARHALRGWEGPDLPPFRRDHGAVPADLLDELDPDEVDAIGWRASDLMQPGRSAEGNSAAPSPSSAIPSDTAAA